MGFYLNKIFMLFVFRDCLAMFTRDGTDYRPKENNIDAHARYFVLIFLSVMFWAGLYIIRSKYSVSRHRPECHCRVVTLIHAVLATSHSFNVSFMMGSNPINKLGEPNTECQNTALALSLGYFLFDLVWFQLQRWSFPFLVASLPA